MIHVLNKETIDKIAAGEVIERPESVVKELLDNAVDSGADSISIEIRGGGLDLIRVTDNGCGIAREEIPTAFLRHATSKLSNAEDLTHIRTMGFRGEALASICGVAEVELVTKRKEDFYGSRYRIAGGTEQDLSEIGAPDGSSVIVRNLFYNVPVRKSFLKSAKTESSYIVDIAEKTALAHPEIAVSLTADGRLLLRTSGNGKLRDCIYTIYGRDVEKDLIPLSVTLDGIRIAGCIGKPVIARSRREFEVYFVNERYVRSSVIERAIEDAYAPFMMQHKFPFVVLNLTVDPAKVDVNVHPKKMEVRFSDNAFISGAVEAAITGALKREELIIDAPKEEASAGLKAPRVSFGGEGSAGAGSLEPTASSGKIRSPEAFETKREAALGRPSAPAFGIASASPPSRAPRSDEPLRKAVQEVQQAVAVADAVDTGMYAGRDTGKHAGKDTGEYADRNIGANTNEAAENKAASADKPEQLRLDERFLSPSSVPHFHLIGQVFNTYWIIEYQDSMYLIDQHAAHEKVNYERFMKLIENRQVEAQMILPPILLTLTLREAQLLQENMEAFTQLGYEIEAGEGRDFIVRAVPSNLPGLADKGLLMELIDSLDEIHGLRSPERVREKVASMSCKAAVKGNRVLTKPEMEALIGELLTLDNPYACPHGRPTIAKWTKYELDKIFKRIV